MSRPSRADLQRAAGKKLRDVIGPQLQILFCGINPSLYSAAVGHHFGRPGNRFWPALHWSGFTSRQLAPDEQRELLALGYGITNIVARATAAAGELGDDEIVAGARRLRGRVERYRPRVLAVLGIGAYRTAFARPRASLGLQDVRFGDTRVWVLPNPSGLNAHYQRAELTALFTELRLAAGRAGD